MIELIAMCAPDVAPHTIQEIIRVESGGNPLAINVNRLPGQKSAPRPKPAESPAQAKAIVLKYIQAGHTVDMGLMQINSANLRWLGISQDGLEVLFNPCANITAGAAILGESYGRAANEYGSGQVALKAALSAYNTGNFSSGLANGYVARYYGKAKSGHVALKTGQPQRSASAADALRAPTGISWTPPEGYHPSSTPKKGSEQMDSNRDKTPTREELEAIDVAELKAKFLDAAPGLAVEFDPDEADRMGAFEESAMSLEDAIEASTDPREG